MRRAQAQGTEGWRETFAILPCVTPRASPPRAAGLHHIPRTRAQVLSWLWGKMECHKRKGKREREDMEKEAEGVCGQLFRGLWGYRYGT